ncbi:hypothetical protein SAMD00019534_008040 [Acytostelium subglobosum LB1]|uniref:hypothetical protein n=1 Tax=Acytostelium subglobosum LB1 TaxID=1410327 RepID=UPI0006450DC2|nr:hypothetical protein SAMD00019534_008040 [Acytostelium subglobosum LB1]GAM17629.1 hypothetical protein SAMD00019534_008040 [Acytostelium subglobosum LB1]|eukprot:XP_012758225.1 hypothetical protein SAMD00019534_008040 [Acytostelium subglobosum LB1]
MKRPLEEVVNVDGDDDDDEAIEFDFEEPPPSQPPITLSPAAGVQRRTTPTKPPLKLSLTTPSIQQQHQLQQQQIQAQHLQSLPATVPSQTIQTTLPFINLNPNNNNNKYNNNNNRNNNNNNASSQSTPDKTQYAPCPFCSKEFMMFKLSDHVQECGSNQSPKKKHQPSIPTTSSSSSNLFDSILIRKPTTNTSTTTTTTTNPSAGIQSQHPFTSNNNDSTTSHNNNNNDSTNNHNTHVNTKQEKRFTNMRSMPLAEKIRPDDFDEFVGQEQIMAPDSLMANLMKSGNFPSFILWGPPGCGKTTLAKLAASKCDSLFVSLSAVSCGVDEIRKVVKNAEQKLTFNKQRTVLFLDEVHRFNKSQQDILLPFIENGTFTFIGATTENPSFHLNNALQSRCKVIVLNKLTPENIELIINRAIDSSNKYGRKQLTMDAETIRTLAELTDGDARAAINVVEMAINGSKFSEEQIVITRAQLGGLLQRTSLMNDKKGDNHYDMISALHKSIRGSDANATTYWLVRMLESGSEPLFVARRMIRMASEDVGLADPLAMGITVAAFQAVQFVGLPECKLSLLQAAVYLAQAPKSNSLEEAYINTTKYVMEKANPPVPLHICNAPTGLMKTLGYGKGYQYNHAYDNQAEVTQTYLPPSMADEVFFQYKQTCTGVELGPLPTTSGPPAIAFKSIYQPTTTTTADSQLKALPPPMVNAQLQLTQKAHTTLKLESGNDNGNNGTNFQTHQVKAPDTRTLQ